MSYQTTSNDERAGYESFDSRFFQVDETPSAVDIAATPARRQRLAVRSLVVGGVLMLSGFAGKAVLESSSTAPAMSLDVGALDVGAGMGDGPAPSAGMGIYNHGEGAVTAAATDSVEDDGEASDGHPLNAELAEAKFHHPFVFCKTLDGLCKRVSTGKVCDGDDDAGISNAFNICGDYNASQPSSSCYLDCTELRYTCRYKKDDLCPIAPSATPSAAPTAPPTKEPTGPPSAAPSHEPSYGPTSLPTPAPSAEPTYEPSYAPTYGPTAAPSAEPTAKPTSEPTAKPTAEPTAAPSAEPTSKPSAEPTPSPTADPSYSPTSSPTYGPSYSPTPSPSAEPTGKPSAVPTSAPTTPMPSPAPGDPTSVPTTAAPSAEPTYEPSYAPTYGPTASPSAEPTGEPTAAPSTEPTNEPTSEPTVEPSAEPTYGPTYSPSSAPSADPTYSPTSVPTTPMPSPAPGDPTSTPTSKPTTGTPSSEPTPSPTSQPANKKFDFCDTNPGLDITSGGFKFNATYRNKTCIAKPTDYSDQNLCDASEYSIQNATVNVTFIKEDVTKGQVVAVGLRSKANDDAWSGSYCQGYEKVMCNAQAKSLSKVKLEFKMCGTKGTYIDLHHTSYVDFSPNKWYKISFSAVGDVLACALYQADDNAVAYGEPLISHEMNALNNSRYGDDGIVNEAGAPEFGTYSNSVYFSRFHFQNLDKTVEEFDYIA